MNRCSNQWFWIVLIAFCNLAVVSEAQKGNFSYGAGSWYGSEDDSWGTVSKYSDISGYKPKPENPGDYRVAFQEVTLDAFGNICTIKGRLEYDVEKKAKPVDWFQGVAVYLAKKPGESRDWSSGISANADHDSSILNNDGTFTVSFDLRETNREPGKRGKHQIGVALATHQPNKKGNRQSVTLKPSYPAVETSIQMLQIPASVKISKELRLIDLASGWPFSDPDGTKLVRAVNGLRPLGKKKALELLQQYVDGLDVFRDEGEIVFWIIRLLFEPADLRQQIDSPSIHVLFNTGDKGDFIGGYSVLWPLDPIELCHDVPFMLGRQIGGSGMPEHPNSHIRWATKLGVIRESPLVPKNPLLAAERLLQSKKYKALPSDSDWDHNTRRIREQAITMCKAMASPDDYSEISDAQWKRLLGSAAARKVWDQARQELVAPEK